jgi:excisionase family DNA binding protein
MPTIEGYYTTKEAADELGLSHVTMRDAVRRGVIEAKKVARRSLIPAAEVERYRTEHLGQLGWDKRKQPDYTPNEKLRVYQRAYYQRRKAARKQQPATTPAENKE